MNGSKELARLMPSVLGPMARKLLIYVVMTSHGPGGNGTKTKHTHTHTHLVLTDIPDC